MSGDTQQTSGGTDKGNDMTLAQQNSVTPDFSVPRAALVSPDRPFKPAQLSRIDEALTLASRETGLLFSVYVGELGADPRATAEAMFTKLAASNAAPVLLAVSPGQRKLGDHHRRRGRAPDSQPCRRPGRTRDACVVHVRRSDRRHRRWPASARRRGRYGLSRRLGCDCASTMTICTTL